MNTQSTRLLAHLTASPHAIDPLTSWTQLGIYRLAARIHDLVSEGHRIEKDWRTVHNSYGEKVRVRTYRLAQ